MQKHIFIVDDEKDIGAVTKRALERNGFLVTVFDDPEDALLNFKTGFYDLLLLDIRMPKINGVDLYKKIMKLDSKAKVCFFTAFEAYQEYEEEFLRLDIRCFIKKPISISDLIRIIDAELGTD